MASTSASCLLSSTVQSISLTRSRCGVFSQHRLHGSYPRRLRWITPGWRVIDVKQMVDNLFYMRPCLGRVAFTLDPVRGVAFVLAALLLQVAAPHASVVLAALLCTHAVTSRQRDNSRKVDDEGVRVRGGAPWPGLGEGSRSCLFILARATAVRGRALCWSVGDHRCVHLASVCTPGRRVHICFVRFAGMCCVCS